MKLNQLSDNPGARKGRMRVGARHRLGQGQDRRARRQGPDRAHRRRINGFEGGQMPLHMRMPKRGFNNIFRRDYVVVNLGRLQTAVDAGKLDAGQTDRPATRWRRPGSLRPRRATASACSARAS